MHGAVLACIDNAMDNNSETAHRSSACHLEVDGDSAGLTLLVLLDKSFRKREPHRAKQKNDATRFIDTIARCVNDPSPRSPSILKLFLDASSSGVEPSFSELPWKKSPSRDFGSAWAKGRELCTPSRGVTLTALRLSQPTPVSGV